MSLTFNLTTIDWTALGAIASGLATIAAAFAAVAAFRASATALRIDGQQARRAEEGRKRSARAMIVPIMHELYLVDTKLRAALDFAVGLNNDTARFQAYSEMTGRTKIPLLERFVDRFGDFDDKIAIALSNALSVVLQMKMNETPDVATLDPAVLPDSVAAMKGEMENTLAHVKAARTALQPAFDEIVGADKK
jgi:hypothetical protein